MKPISKIKLFGAAVCCASLALVPVLAVAQRSGSSTPLGDQAPGGLVQTQNAFCTKLNSAGSAFLSRLTEKYEQVVKNKQNRISTLKTNRTERSKELLQVRNEAASTTNAVMLKLKDRAQTDAQKQAITKFQQQVRAAAAARKAAVDAAMSAFRSGLDSEAANREKLMQEAANRYKTAVEAAIAKAKSACASNQDPATIKTALLEALKAAQQKLQQDKQALGQRGEKISALAHTRNQAVREAADAFKAAMEKARVELKAAIQNQEQTQDQTQTD